MSCRVGSNGPVSAENRKVENDIVWNVVVGIFETDSASVVEGRA